MIYHFVLWLFRIPLWIIHPISVLCFVKRFVKMKAKSCIEIQISFINLFPVFLIHIFVFNCFHSWIRRANKCAIKMNIVVAISLSLGSNDEWNEWADTCSFLHFYVWTSCGRQYEFGHRKDLLLYSCLLIFRNLHSFHFHKRTNDFFCEFLRMRGRILWINSLHTSNVLNNLQIRSCIYWKNIVQNSKKKIDSVIYKINCVYIFHK